MRLLFSWFCFRFSPTWSSHSGLFFCLFAAVGVVAPAGCRDERDLLVLGEQRGDPPPSPQRNDLRGPGRLRAHVAGENSGAQQEQDARDFTASSSQFLQERQESQPGIISAVK